MRGRFDIISAAPEYWLETVNGQPQWHGDHPPDIPLAGLSSLDALHQLLEFIQKSSIDYSGCRSAELPFCGGLIGYCSYDLAREYITLAEHAIRDIDIPEMQFGFYGWACIQDHALQKSWLTIHPGCRHELRESINSIILHKNHFQGKTTIQSESDTGFNTDKNNYLEKFSKIQEYIKNGDCYQINFSQRFSIKTKSKPLEIYNNIRKLMPSPFCTLLPFLGRNEYDAIISFSPERFVKIDKNRQVITQPIKGTSKRHVDKKTDEISKEFLINDKKNQAENLMIVDLLRNDIGRICETGSIKVKNLFELQTFSNVHHLVSTIEGKLKEGINGADILKACFPGGSITGAPKIRAMQIIEELEKCRRSIYCGSIAMFSACGLMDSNITIRTVLLHNKTAYCWGGGGIVADSNADDEYAESIEKVRIILEALENNESGIKKPG